MLFCLTLLTTLSTYTRCIFTVRNVVRQDNVFTLVCHSFCSQGVSALVHAGIQPPGVAPPGRHPPRQTHPLPSACWDIHAYWCGRYASYLNAFLLFVNWLFGKELILPELLHVPNVF